jgi:hypothetical protein
MIREVRNRYVNTEYPPASTAVEVRKLAFDDFLLVQRFMTLDNSDISPIRLTALSTLLILASHGALHAPISSSEDSDGPSSVRVSARGLSPSLSDTAWAS